MARYSFDIWSACTSWLQIYELLVCLELTFSTYLVQISHSHGSLSAEAVSNEMCAIFIFVQLQPDACGLFTFENEITNAMLHSSG